MPAYLCAAARPLSLVSKIARHVRRPATLLAAVSLTLLLVPALTVSASDQHVRVEALRMQAPVPGSTYKVQDGDSLYSIAADLGIADAKVAAWVEAFLELNDMDDPDMLTAGQTVKIPGTTPASSTSSPTTSSSVSSSTSAGGSRAYTVQSGDTLYGIASNLNVPGEKLYDWVQATLALNDMEGGDSLVVGKTIQISTRHVPVPKPITSAYTVKGGDTLGEIASKSGVPDSGYLGWLALVLELNSLESANLLREGQVLQLPVTSGSGTTTSNNTASSSNSGPSPTSQNVSLSRPAQPSTTTYVVKAGDTLEGIGIAQKVGETQLRQWVEDVRKLNKLNDEAFIAEGQKLELPSMSVAPPPTTAGGTSQSNSTTGSPPPPPPPASSTSTNSTTTANTTSQSSSNSTTSTSSALQNAPRSMTGCFYVIKAEDDLVGIAKKVGVEPAKVDGWITQLKQMNGVDFKVMPVGTAIQMPC